MAMQFVSAVATIVGIAFMAQEFPESRLDPLLSVAVFAVSLLAATTVRSGTKTILGSLSPSQLRVSFLIFLVPTVICMFGLGLLGEFFRTPQTPYGIISFELAFTMQRVKAIIDSWTPFQLNLVLYSTTLALCCLLVGKGAEISYDVAGLQFLAAICDFFEGMFLLPVMLDLPTGNDERNIVGAGVCASVKFALITIGLIYIVGMLGMHKLIPTSS